MELKARQRSWQEIIPVQTIRDDVIISRRGELTIGWELSLPHAYSLSESDYDAMILRYYEAVRKLPAWTVVHRQDMYLWDHWHPAKEQRWQKGFLEDSFDRHFEGRRYLRHRAFLWLTLSGKASLSKKGADSGYFGYRFLADMPSEEKISQFLTSAREFIGSAFDPSVVKARRLTREDLEGDDERIGIIQKVASFGDESPVMSDYDEGKDFVQYRDHRAISFSISQGSHMPTEIFTTSAAGPSADANSKIYLSYAAGLGIMLPCEHIVNHFIMVPAQDDTMQEFENRKSRMTSGITSSDNRVNAAELHEYIDDVNRLGLFTVRSNVTVVAWDSPGKQEELRSLLSSAISALKIKAVYNGLNTPILWYAGIPGAEAELGKENYMPMELLSSLCLGGWETFDEGVKDGMLRLVDRIRHIPVTIDTQVAALQSQLITNYNACVFGASGSGKSFFMNTYLRNCYDSGEHVCVIDVGDSYEGLCALIHQESGQKDGVYLSWDVDHPFSFNPFVGFKGDGSVENPGWLTPEGTIRQDENGVNFMISFLMTAYSPRDGWTEQNSTVLVSMLERFIRDYVKSGREENPIFDDFYRYVNDVVAPMICYQSVHAEMQGGETAEEKALRRERQAADEKANGYFIHSVRVTPSVFDVSSFILALEAYSMEGRFGFLLNDRNPDDLFASRFTVFEVDALANIKNATFYSLCVLCIMNAFDMKMRHESAFKVLVIEEAWKAIANETMAPYLAGLWKTSRKFRVSGMVVTQQISDILSSDVIRDTILQNSAVRILLDQKNNRGIFPQIKETLALSDTDANLALSVGCGLDARYGKYKEVFIKLGDTKSSVYAIEASPEEALAYESDKVGKLPFITLGRQIGFMQAARQMADEIKHRKQ